MSESEELSTSKIMQQAYHGKLGPSSACDYLDYFTHSFFDIKDEFNVNVWNSSYKLVEKGQYFSMTPFVQTWCLADYVCYSVIGTLQ